MGPRKPADYLLFAALLGGALPLIVARSLRRVEVAGESMLGALQAGDRLLVVRWLRVRPGQIVVLPDPRDGGRTLVKRVAAVLPEGVLVRGDNPVASTDGRQFGPVPRPAIVGRAFYRYHPACRRGRLEAHPVTFAQPGSWEGDRSW